MYDQNRRVKEGGKERRKGEGKGGKNRYVGGKIKGK